MDNPDRILIIRPSALGDVCRTVPVLVSLRRAYPSATIDWLVQDSFMDAVRSHPDLTEAVAFPRRALGRAAARGRIFPSLRWLGGLRRRRYDLAIDCQGLARSGLFAWATRAPCRVGYSDARELAWLGVNKRHRVTSAGHAVDRMLSLVECIGVEPVVDLRLYPPPEDRERVAADRELAGARYAVIAPTSRWPAKRWPIDRFIEIARALESRGLSVVVVGSSGEREQCRALLTAAETNDAFIDRVGRTSVGTLMAIIEGAQLVIANDSAALHMAVGFDRPLIALYGPTRVERVGPYGRQADVIQHVTPDDRIDHKVAANVALMERITTGEVIERIDERLR
ncbi:MAG: glycosyltransferase family 9 protein [Planctomycetes bacterium]|nr:glycosyltransferase family 9 protein [Planctomycetota bacterium]